MMSEEAKSMPAWLVEHHQVLLQQFRANSLSHAVLLSGEQGIGKVFLANALAAAMLCKQEDNVACGECHSCKLTLAETHPDLIYVTPEDGKKIISVDQVRGLMSKVYSTPQICDNKVIIISPADKLNHNAANALLKCLEEPPANTYFLVCTAFASRLPATVRSRCRIKFIASPDNELATQWLEKQGVPSAEVADRLSVCSGRPLAALENGENILALHAAVRTAIDGIGTGTASANQLAGGLQEFDIAELLPAYLLELVGLSKEACLENSVSLATGSSDVSLVRWSTQALLAHAESVQKLFRSVQAGSILNAQLATEDMLVNLQMCRQH